MKIGIMVDIFIMFKNVMSSEHVHRTALKNRKHLFLLLILLAWCAIGKSNLASQRDVAVFGFDEDPMAALFDPFLTTIYYPLYERDCISFEVFKDYGKKSVHTAQSGRRGIRRTIFFTTNLIKSKRIVILGL